MKSPKKSQAIPISKLRENIYQIFDEVISSGEPIQVKRGVHLLKIEALTLEDKFAYLKKNKGFIKGDSKDLANLSWEKSWKPSF